MPNTNRGDNRPWTFAGSPKGELERIHTPAMTGVEDVARLLQAEPRDLLKTLVFQPIARGRALNSGVNPNWVVAVVRGDHDVSLPKLRAAAAEHFQVELRPSEDSPEMRERFAVGFVGPDAAMRYWDAVLIVDPDAAQDQPWIAGANEMDFHVRNFNWFRECGDKLADPRKTIVADIRSTGVSPVSDGATLGDELQR